MDYRTEKALLAQQNELLELELQELREREDAYKIFNETILNAYNSMQSDLSKQNSQVYKQLQQTLEQYSKELIESKNRNASQLMQLEKENRQLKHYLERMEHKIQEQKLLQDSELCDLEQQFNAQQEQAVIITKPKKKKQEDKENAKPETGGGCIVSLKSKNEDAKKLYSNVMEISQLDWLDQSSPTGLFKQFQIHQRGRDHSDHSQRTQQSQLSRRVIRDQRKSQESISPNRNPSPNNYITPDTKQLKYDLKTHNTNLPLKENKFETNKQEKRSLAEFTKQINSVRSTENFQVILRQSQMS